jgi:sialidase-1
MESATFAGRMRPMLAGAIAVAVLLVGHSEASAQSGRDDVFKLIVARATPTNPRNSESAMIDLKDGKLLLGWTEFYASGGGDEAPARLVARVSADGGRTWGDKYTIVENDGKCNVMVVNLLRLKGGDVALFHLQKNVETGGKAAPDCRVMLRTSRDEGRTFGPARQLSGEKRYVEMGPGRALRLKTGRILLECDSDEKAFCLISDDDGGSWREGQPVKPAGGGCWEPAAVELNDGRVLMFMRTQLGGQYQAISTDGAETWAAATPSLLRGTGSPICIKRIPASGDLLAIWNHDPGGPRPRNPLTAAISRDEGQTWEHFRNVADAPNDAFAYPSVAFVGDRLLVTYFNYSGGLSLQLQGIPLKWFYE